MEMDFLVLKGIVGAGCVLQCLWRSVKEPLLKDFSLGKGLVARKPMATENHTYRAAPDEALSLYKGISNSSLELSLPTYLISFWGVGAAAIWPANKRFLTDYAKCSELKLGQM